MNAMRLVIGRNALPRCPQRAIVTIGMFDGVHLAHQRLIRTTVHLAKQSHGNSVVITFDPDPQLILDPQRAQPPLMPLEERIRLIGEFGVDLVWVIPFTPHFSQMRAEEFVQTILIDRLHAACIVVGENFAFGRARRGTLELLHTLGRPQGMRVMAIPAVMRSGLPVSSSRIRRCVQVGELEQARRLLGRPVQLWGTVIKGAGRGRTLGFPTANLRLTGTLVPPRGVYHVRLTTARHTYQGLMNLGTRPTFGHGPLTCEVHVVGFRGTLYGKSVALTLVKRLRDERTFQSPQALTRQIQRDLVRAHLLR